MMIWNECLPAREREKSERSVFFRVPLASLEIGRMLVLIVKIEFEGIERYFSKLLQKYRPVQKRLWKPGTQQVPAETRFLLSQIPWIRFSTCRRCRLALLERHRRI